MHFSICLFGCILATVEVIAEVFKWNIKLSVIALKKAIIELITITHYHRYLPRANEATSSLQFDAASTITDELIRKLCPNYATAGSNG